MATGLPIYFERMVLNGATVIDGPELTFQDCILEGGSAETEDGLTTRTWYKTSQFDNHQDILTFQSLRHCIFQVSPHR